MATHDSTPPILRFAVRVLDAASTDELAQACVTELVESFGVVQARVRDDARIRSTAIAPAANGPPGPMLTLRLSGPDEPPIRLELELADAEDLPIVRQQFLDLAGVARRAWSRLDQLERERAEARRDALTGLDNRRGMTEGIDTAWQHALHERGAMSVMLVDLDHFKTVNDTLGHEAGDDVLQLAASSFRAHLRPTDRVCRWGGDEFLILLAGVAAARAEPIAERLRVAFAADPRARGTTMTIGIADTTALPPGDISAPRMIAAADACLLAAKRSGRNRTAIARQWGRVG